MKDWQPTLIRGVIRWGGGCVCLCKRGRWAMINADRYPRQYRPTGEATLAEGGYFRI